MGSVALFRKSYITSVKNLKPFFRKYPLIKVAYLFGSQARGDAGPGSDIDIAVYLDTGDKKKATDILLELSGKLPLILNADKVDVVVLNLADNCILKNNIVTQGKVIYEVPKYRLDLETRIVGEYRDFRILEGQYYKD
jgi:hypothetical protein